MLLSSSMCKNNKKFLFFVMSWAIEICKGIDVPTLLLLVYFGVSLILSALDASVVSSSPAQMGQAISAGAIAGVASAMGCFLLLLPKKV